MDKTQFIVIFGIMAFLIVILVAIALNLKLHLKKKKEIIQDQLEDNAKLTGKVNFLLNIQAKLATENLQLMFEKSRLKIEVRTHQDTFKAQRKLRELATEKRWKAQLSFIQQKS
jgi:hypothetical protein